METQPELFKRHYAEAGLVEHPLQRGPRQASGQRRARRWRRLRRTIERRWASWRCCPDSPEPHLRQELEFRSALGALPASSSKRQAAPETGEAYAHTRALWEQLEFSAGVPSGALWAVDMPRVLRRIGSGSARGRKIAAAEPCAQ